MATERSTAADPDRADSMTLVRVSALGLSFGAQTLFQGLNFVLRKGELTILRGENGTGKTCLLNVLAGLVEPTAGTIQYQLGGGTIDGSAPPHALARAGLGRVWQDIRLFGSMTVLENVLVALPRSVRVGVISGVFDLLRPAQRADHRARAESLLEEVGLADRANSSCDRLSVGQMKRVALARALASDPSLLLADEPLAGLDEVATIGFRDLLVQLVESRGLSVLMTAHGAEEHLAQVGRTWWLADGKLKERS